MYMPDLDHALTVATLAAEKAGKLILEGLKTNAEFTLKSDASDRVTQVDFDCQKMIQDMLAKEFPEIGFLGEEEEQISANGKLASRSSAQQSEVRWIVDPLDGTMNFTHRIPFCGVSIGLQINGEMVLGVLHFPAFDWTYTAIKGKGAKKNGKEIHVSSCAKFEDAMLTEIFSDREARGKKVSYPPVSAYRRFGSAITSLAFLAEGLVDGTVERCRMWDIAAAEVIIREAGGTVTVWKDDEKDPRTSLTCVASVPKIHEELCSFAKKALV